LYPNIAVSDEFNYCKSASEQFFHTKNKPYTSLHPMGYFSQNHGILNLSEANIVEKTGIYKSKLPLSSRHQILVYLNILETTKAYLMNTMRMPAAQTFLLFAQVKKFTVLDPLSTSKKCIIRIRLRKVMKCLALKDFSQTNSNNTH
jgi:hypothetical protein